MSVWTLVINGFQAFVIIFLIGEVIKSNMTGIAKFAVSFLLASFGLGYVAEVVLITLRSINESLL